MQRNLSGNDWIGMGDHNKCAINRYGVICYFNAAIKMGGGMNMNLF